MRGVGGRAQPDAVEVGGPRDGAREHGDDLVAFVELEDFRAQHVGGDEIGGRPRRVVRGERARRARRGRVRVGAAAARARATSSATPMPPGRSSTGSSPAKATIVDSIPIGARAAVEDRSPPNRRDRRRRVCAVVGEMRPKRLADGAAMPPPNAARSSRATGCDGTRNPTLSWPPVTMSATCDARGRISVSGPGQNAAASFRAPSGTVRAQCGNLRRVVAGGRSPDDRRGGPSPRRCGARLPGCRHRRRVRRRSRSETRRARRRADRSAARAMAAGVGAVDACRS